MIMTAADMSKSGVVTLLKRLASPTGLRLAVAALVALNLVLRIRSNRSGKRRGALVSDLSKVGRRVGESEKSPGGEKAGFDEYDVIVIGGGTAGCILASRLSEDPSIRVLLLEAGGSGMSLPFSRIPAACHRLFHSKYDWDIFTTPQANAGGERKYWPRGKLLGGCTSINAMMYQSGAPSDYDEWASLGGEDAGSWSYKELYPYFQKFEKFVPSNQFALVDASLRGSAGPVEVGYFGHFSNIASKFIEACVKLGIPHNPDVNTSRGTLGVTKLMTYIDSKGRRVSTESAYLSPEVLRRPNLVVAVRAQVTRILFDTSTGNPRATGVEFCTKEGDPRYVAKARHEVIVSSGAVHTPQVLMVSGIGPAEQLRAHSIPVVVDLPGVGQNLIDHPVVNFVFRERSGESLNFLANPRTIVERLKYAAAVAKFVFTGKGPLTCNVGEAAAFIQSSDLENENPDGWEDTTSGPEAPDLELYVSPVGYRKHGESLLPRDDMLGVHAVLLRPTSRGAITIQSSNPFRPPAVDPRYLETKHDVDVLMRGAKKVLSIARTDPFAQLIDHDSKESELDDRLHNVTDEELEKTVRRRVETLYHPVSTARMGSREDGGVVDASLRVYGVSNLRVVDASIFPNIIAGHTTAPTLVVAEKASDIIREDLKKARVM